MPEVSYIQCATIAAADKPVNHLKHVRVTIAMTRVATCVFDLSAGPVGESARNCHSHGPSEGD